MRHVSSWQPLWHSLFALPGRCRDCSFPASSATHSFARKLRAVPHVDPMVLCGPDDFYGDEFPAWTDAAAEAIRSAPRGRHFAQSDSAEHLQVCSRDRPCNAVLFTATIRSSCAAVGNLLLDLPGDELPVRSVPRGGTRSFVCRVRALHGLFPCHDLWAHLPHARDASSISFR